MSLVIAALVLGAFASPTADEDDQSAGPPEVANSSAPNTDDARSRTAPGFQPGDEADDQEERQAPPSSTIVVTAHRLDAARTEIDAGLGSTVYSLTNDTIENRPGGETGSISAILTQAPGVTLSGTALNIRGSPANQVRINNIIVPETISDPADRLSSRLAETTRVLTGTLPAQFGFSPAGVISVTTKNGLYQHGGQVELFAGSDGMLEPALEWAGSAAGTSLYATGSFERGRSTVADAQGFATRERISEVGGLGFADHVIGDSNRVSLLFGGSSERHRFGPTSIGPGTEVSSDGYAVGAFQHSGKGFTLQASLFAGDASDRARFSEPTNEERRSFGTQVDASDQLGAMHMLRFGLLASRSTIHDLDAGANRSSDGRTSLALYAQDEWKITPSLTFNPGARVEWLRGFGSPAKVEPRASLIWQSSSGLTAHAGYARYAAASPVGERPKGMELPDERDDYFDAGVQQHVGSLTLGLDGYWRWIRNYIAEHQTPGSAVRTAFAFKRGRIEGLELSAIYARGPLTAWTNLALANATARTIIGSDSLFSPGALAAAAMRSVPLASERPITASGGLTRRLGKLSLSGDVLVSSGAVRTLTSDEPNAARHPSYALLGLAVVYHVRIAGQPADLRIDLTNLTNARYVTSDAANLEGGWTRRGQSRAIAIGIEQGF